jgi:hypothetical protein
MTGFPEKRPPGVPITRPEGLNPSWFASFAWQAARILAATRGEPSLYYTYDNLPLRLLKQIVCMFMSTNGPQFANVNPLSGESPDRRLVEC